MKEPKYEIITVGKGESDPDVTKKIREVFSKIGEGKYGKKVLLQIEEPDD